MGRALLMIAMAVSLSSGSLLLYSTQSSKLQNEGRVTEYESRVLAKESASAGLAESEAAIFADLAANGSYSGASNYYGKYAGGTYAVSVTQNYDTLKVKSVGSYGDARYAMLRVYAGGGTEPEAPDFFSKPILCDGNVDIKKDFILRTSVPGENASVHGNGNMTFGGDSHGYVEGYATHGGNLKFQNGQTAEEVFQPVSGSGPVTEQVDDIELPALNVSEFEHLATTTTSTNLNISGHYTLGTKSNPAIWYVDGDVTTVGPVTISGYGVLLVAGNFHIHDSISLLDAGTHSTMGLYVGNNVHINAGNQTFAGQWYVNNNIHVNGPLNLNGSMTTPGGDCHFSESVNVNYRKASAALTDPFWPDASTEGESAALQLVNAREW